VAAVVSDSYLYVRLTDAEVLDMAKAHLRNANAAPQASKEAARETLAFHRVMAVLSRRQLTRLAAEIRACRERRCPEG
jgi:hypothetical protein